MHSTGAYSPSSRSGAQEETENEPGANREDKSEEKRPVQTADALFAFGSTTLLGLGYSFGHLKQQDRHSVGSQTFGIDIGGILDNGKFEAGFAHLSYRGFLGFGAAGISMRPRLGLASSGKTTVPASSLTFSIGAYPLEAGYTLQVPLALSRPTWMTTHFFALEVSIPTKMDR